MKMKSLFVAMITFFSAAPFAHWQPIGNAEYTWGPFHLYTIGLFSETGTYQENERPLMLSFKYEKPIEGKNFAITLIKEIETLKLNDGDTQSWLKEMQATFPDFSPNDILNYIALPDRGYFVLNDTVLEHDFDAKFNQAFIGIWLAPNSTFVKLQPQLLGKTKSNHEATEFYLKPEIESFDEQDSTPELPPNYLLDSQKKSQG
ncbi:TPA: chalcone isomerase family protein [Haemophilus influenzae]|uniref:chalcone isomerase family protein n=1 Tax=Haemophilus influenzae TaxID=727 RepID=UPI001598AF68|nr:chalcone isomerase family protein [Haemophilus influenzae]BCB66929.1 hypothetical protein HIY_14740 [Haemophilus influenzae]